MSKEVSEVMLRLSAEITPTDSDCSSPKGLPIAATGAPTVRLDDDPSGSGVSLSPLVGTLSRATSALGSSPTIFAGTRLWSGNST